MHVCMYTHIRICSSMHASMYVCIYTHAYLLKVGSGSHMCMCACMYVCIYTHRYLLKVGSSREGGGEDHIRV
jgi:hypothetical protein